ncbi:MAG TPA: GNAT family N-acetyltransferase, partial [Dyella sp.]|nr:GNAT family N-acetyltransferase [Dyella sp.]
MELSTARLRLTALRETDADALFGYRSDPAVARYQSWCPSARTDALAFIRAQQERPDDPRGRWMQRAIRLSDSDGLIGDLGVHIPTDPDGSYEVGISIAPAHQGLGYARESLEA